MTWIDQFTEMLFSLDKSKVNIEKAYMLKHKYLPTSIFKYREINPYSLQNLKEDTIWLADPKNFNDPYDCGHMIDYNVIEKHNSKTYFNSLLKDQKVPLSSEEIKQLQLVDDPFSEVIEIIISREPEEKRQPIRDMLSHLRRKIHEDLNKDSANNVSDGFKVCSFSERNDSMLMWSHYANYHKGFCIEYDLTNIPYNDYRRRFLYPVIYSNNIFDATDFFKLDIHDENFNSLHLGLSSLIKAQDWSYEKEWRLVFSGGIMEQEQSYAMGKPKMIFLGSKMVLEDQKKLISICEKKDIPYQKMKINHKEYKVEPTNLQDAEQYFFKK